MSSADKEARVQEFEEFLVVDNTRIFFKATVEVFWEGQSSPFFSWNTWGETTRETFLPAGQKLQAGEPASFPGSIPSITVFYEPGGHLNCTFTIFPEEGKTIVSVDTPSQLKTDQSKPITTERVIELMNRLHHREDKNTGQKDNRPFDERLKESLEIAQKDYLDKKKQVCITLLASPAIGCQIVSSSILEISTDAAVGLGLHLPFDEATERGIFENHPEAKHFHLHVWDGIPTWQRDFGMDFEQLLNVTMMLLIEVFKVDVEKIELDVFEV